MRDVPQRGTKCIRRKRMPFSPHSASRRMILRTGPFDGGRTRIRRLSAYLSGNVELAFLGHPFKSLGRVFDTVLAVIAIGRKQPDDLIGSAGGRTRDIAGSKIDSLSNGEFVLQRPLHHAKTSAVLTVPLQPPTEKPCGYIAQRRTRWPVTSGHGKCADFAGFSVR